MSNSIVVSRRHPGVWCGCGSRCGSRLGARLQSRLDVQLAEGFGPPSAANMAPTVAGATAPLLEATAERSDAAAQWHEARRPFVNLAADQAEERSIQQKPMQQQSSHAKLRPLSSCVRDAVASVVDVRLVCFASLAFANIVCQATFSVLPTFYPAVARAKGMSEFMVGVSFAVLPAVVFIVSTFADRMLHRHGRRRAFILGSLIVACFTFLLGCAIFVPDGLTFVVYCLSMQGACLPLASPSKSAPYHLHAALLTSRVFAPPLATLHSRPGLRQRPRRSRLLRPHLRALP